MGAQRISIERMGSPLDAERLKVVGKATRPRRCARHQRFVKGPLPLPWLARAARLPGKALAVGLAAWYLAGMAKSRTVKLTRATLDQFGVERKAGYRAVEKLESAGLVSVRRHRGRSPVLTINDISEELKTDAGRSRVEEQDEGIKRPKGERRCLNSQVGSRTSIRKAPETDAGYS